MLECKTYRLAPPFATTFAASICQDVVPSPTSSYSNEIHYQAHWVEAHKFSSITETIKVGRCGVVRLCLLGGEMGGGGKWRW